MTEKRMRITDMCIYIDSVKYTDKFDSTKVYNYLRTIIKVLAARHKYFFNPITFEEFADFAAPRIMNRLNEEKQTHLPKIKNTLDYIKSILFPLKCDFLDNKRTIEEELDEDVDNFKHTYILKNLNTTTEKMLETDIEVLLSHTKGIILEAINETLHGQNKQIRKELYISCLLSLVRSLTINNINKQKMGSLQRYCLYDSIDNYAEKIYQEEFDTAPIVYNLPKQYKQLVRILLINITNKISREIEEILRDYYIGEDALREITINSNWGYLHD